MTVRTKILLASTLILLGQVVYFHEYISPFYWGQIKVSGLACTCPDETVINGGLYLKYITPDSLKKYNLDYSEIYVTERPSTTYDPMGVDLYIIKGTVIGKQRVSKYDPWNPKIKIDEWKVVDLIDDWGIKILLGFELLIVLIITSNTFIKRIQKKKAN